MAPSPGINEQQKEIPTFVITNLEETSYASVTQKSVKRDQGIILDCVDDLNLTDYTCAIGDLVNKTNVLSASRISNNRVCVYVSSKELVNKITEKNEFILINEKKVTLRPLVSRHKRLIFSNVATEIPNYALENVISQLNVKRASPVTTLRAAINKDGYGHVTSFRRQIFVRPEDISKIPELFKINYDNFDYYIFAGTDVVKCYNCKLDGHLARNCPKADLYTNISTSHTQSNCNDTQPTYKIDLNTSTQKYPTEEKPTNTDELHENNLIEIEQSPENKRTHSVISSKYTNHYLEHTKDRK